MGIQLQTAVGSGRLRDQRIERIKNAKTAGESSRMGFIDFIIDKLNGGKKKRACELLWQMMHYQRQREIVTPAIFFDGKLRKAKPISYDMKGLIKNWFELKKLLSANSRANLRFEISPVKIDDSGSCDASGLDMPSEHPTKIAFEFKLILGADEYDLGSSEAISTQSDPFAAEQSSGENISPALSRAASAGLKYDSVVEETAISLNCFVVELDAASDMQRIIAENDELHDQLNQLNLQIDEANQWLTETEEPLSEQGGASNTKNIAKDEEKQNEQSNLDGNNTQPVCEDDYVPEKTKTALNSASGKTASGNSHRNKYGLLSAEEYSECLSKYQEFNDNPDFFINLNMEEITAYFERKTSREHQLVNDVSHWPETKQLTGEVKAAEQEDKKLQQEAASIHYTWNFIVRRYIEELEEIRLRWQNELELNKILHSDNKMLSRYHTEFALDAESTEQHFSEKDSDSGFNKRPEVKINLKAEQLRPQTELLKEQLDSRYGRLCNNYGHNKQAADSDLENIIEETIRENTNEISHAVNALSSEQRLNINPLIIA